MAHRPRVKAAALGALLTGESVTAVAKMTGIPKQTISRWKLCDLPLILRPLAAQHPELVRLGQALRASRSQWNGTKKKEIRPAD